LISTKNGAGSEKINHSIDDNDQIYLTLEHNVGVGAPTPNTAKNLDITFGSPKS